MDFLLTSTRAIELRKKIELSEELIKKLKNVEYLVLSFLFKPTDSTFDQLSRTCRNLRFLTLRQQMLTRRVLTIMSNHLSSLESLCTPECHYSSLEPLAKFQNLDAVILSFCPPEDELVFIYENSRTLENVSILSCLSKQQIKFKSTIGAIKSHEMTVSNLDGYEEKLVEFPHRQAMFNYYYVNYHSNQLHF